MTGNPNWARSAWAMVKATGFGYEDLSGLRDDRVRRALAEGLDDDVIADALRDNVRALVALGGDRLREAVYLSSPSAYSGVDRLLGKEFDPGAMDSRTKQQVLTLAMYVQRLCVKNESTSFFGPAYWARLGPAGVDRTVVEPSTDEPRRGVFFAHWAAEALAALISADEQVRPELVPAIPPNLFVREDVVRSATFVEAPVEVSDVDLPSDPLGRALWTACDGKATVRDLAAATGAAVDDVLAALDDLDRRGLVRLGFQVPIGLAEPVDWLLDVVGQLPDEPRSRWLPAVRDLLAHKEVFATARGSQARIEANRAASALFTSITGASGSRNAGALAADRSIMIEDCAADWPRFDVGGPLLDYLDGELPRVLDVLFELPLARRRARVAMIKEWFDARFPRDVPVPLDEVLLAAQADGHALGRRLRAVDDEIRRDGPSALTDELLRDPGRGRVELDLAWADRVRAGMPFDTWCVSGVDLFVNAASVAEINADRFTAVVGEVHALHDQLLQGLWPRVHPAPDELAADVARLIGGVTDRVVCDPTLPHRRKTMAREDVLPEVEFADPSPRPDGRRVRAGDLHVLSTGDELELVGKPLGRIALTRPPLWWWDREVDSVFGAFTGARIANMTDTVRAVEPGTLSHRPRITVGRTVLTRETWWLPAAPQPGKYRNLMPANQRRIWALKDEFGLPDQVFARFPEESKPVFVDFDVPVLVDTFARLWQRTAGPVEVGEMCPGPDQLWLRDHRGRHTSELRIGYYRRPSA